MYICILLNSLNSDNTLASCWVVCSLIVMDVVFSNRISSAIFKECARSILDNKQYTEVPIELRKKIEDCFDNYLDQANIVIKGVTKADNLIPDPPRPQ